MNLVAAAGRPTHVAMRLLREKIAKIGGSLRAVARAEPGLASGCIHIRICVRIAGGPAINETRGAQNDVLELIDRSGEPVVVQLARAITALEQQPEGMFSR